MSTLIGSPAPMHPADGNMEPTPVVDRWARRLAMATAAATMVLLLLGGLVTTFDVGMAVPDAPTTFGHNLLLFPIAQWLTASWGVFLEHGHRLFASLVGLLTLALASVLWRGSGQRWLVWLVTVAVAAAFAAGWFGVAGLLVLGLAVTAMAAAGWRWQPRRRLGWLALAAVGAVLLQGGLGALRVVLNDRAMAAVHGCAAQAFFILIVSVAALVTGRRSGAAALRRRSSASQLRRWTGMALAASALVYVQSCLGAVVRHLGAGPANVWLLLHAAVGTAVLVSVVWLSWQIATDGQPWATGRRLARFACVAAVVQVAIGAGTWWTSSGFGPYALRAPGVGQVLLATGHVAVGALLLASLFVLAVHCYWASCELERPLSASSASGQEQALADTAARYQDGVVGGAMAPLGGRVP